MNNFNPFSETYLTVTMPLNDAMIEALESSEQYSHLLDDLHRAQKNTAYDNAYCVMSVAFDFISMETFFSINTVCSTVDGYSDSDGEMNIPLDPETADYFKTEALKHLARNFKAMQKCNPARVAVSA